MRANNSLLRTLALVSIGTTLCGFSAEKHPNILLIFADDLGYGDLGCYGAEKIQTPNIDRLAKEGRRFTDAHSASAVCTPSRYALLTGEYPMRANGGRGIWGPLNWYSRMLIPTETFTIGKLLQADGYATSCIGKWHLGWGDEEKNDWSMPLKSGPNQLGFDHYWGVPRVNCNPPYVYVENDMVVGHDPDDPLVILKEGETPTPTRTFPPEASHKSRNMFRGAVKAHELYDDELVGTRLTEEAVKWIEKNKEEPFFMLFSTVQIHHPFTPAPRFKETSDCGLYGDYTHEFDWMVGELMRCLEENGLSDDTLVILTSDNGGMFNSAGFDAFEDGHRINGDLLGYKFGAWEGGHRVPFIAKWPGQIPAGTESDQLVCSIDMLATFAALTGQEVDPVDSVNILPALTGDPKEPVRDELLLAAVKSSHLSLRQGKWMYIPDQGAGGFDGTKPGSHGFAGPAAASFTGRSNSDLVDGKVREDAPPAQLYDLEADLKQTKNLYHQHPEVVSRMSQRLEELRKSSKDRGSVSLKPEVSSLFDGKTLEGWKTIDPTMAHLWSVKDGMIECSNGGEKMPGATYLATTREFVDFELNCEFRLSGDPSTGLINSGIQYRSKVIAHPKTGKPLIQGYQADIGKGYWGGIYDECRRASLDKGITDALFADGFKDDDWHRYRVVCKGGEHRLYINGFATSDYRELDASIPDKGVIAFQLHAGGAAKLQLRNITIQELQRDH